MIVLCGALLAPLVLAVPARASDLSVRIAPDQPVAALMSTDGYTLTIANETGADIVAQDVSFLLPGHGTPPLKHGDVFGDPRSNEDVTAAFHYQSGSTTGWTTDEPTIDVRWLHWSEVTVPALGSIALHFLVTTSDAKAYYVGAATATSDASVSGTRKGAQIQIISTPAFDIGSTVDRTRIPHGGTVTYTTDLVNNSDDAAVVSKIQVGYTLGVHYVPDSTAGDLGAGEPTIKARQTEKVTWTGPFTVPAQTTLHLVYDLTVEPRVNGIISGVRARAFFATPFHDLKFAGSGPMGPFAICPADCRSSPTG